MTYRLQKRQALLAKIEAVYGTDSTPAGATDAMYVYDLNITPMELARADRNPVRPFFGADVPALGGTPVKVEFGIPIAGGGGAGTAPGYDCILRACGRAATTSAGVSVAYAPVSSGFESATLYANKDGVRHKVTGFRGNASVEFAHNGLPMYKVSGQGIYSAPADQALPALTFGATWPKPLVQNKVNTTLTLHGYSAVLSKLAYDPALAVSWKDWVNNAEEVRITDRPKVTGSCSIEADTIAGKDWFGIAKAGTTAALQLVHGIAAGNKWQLDAATVLITNPAYEEEDGILMMKLGLEFFPTSAGNDEFTETVL